MKKLLSALLVVAMLAVLAIPAVATGTIYDVQITSVIEVDEAYQNTDGSGVYWWESEGKFDAVVAGKELKGITLNNLEGAIYEAYGISVSYRASASGNPWEVGNTYPVTVDFITWEEGTELEIPVVTLNAEVKVCETKIASVSVKPVTMYVGQEYKALHPVITYKDGSEEVLSGGYSYDWEYPTEVGTYHYTISFSAFQNVPVTVTVLPVPTSGKCGENINWAYDAATKKLTLTGTGEMYQIAKDLDTFWNEDYDYEPPFWYCDVETIVVGEGITKLPDYAFGWLNQKVLQLPSSLKSLPEFWLTVSTNMESLTIPEGITSLTGWPFGSPGNSFTSLKELYLPSTLKQMDEISVVLSGLSNRDASVTLQNIHFAGTEAQWKAITRVDSQSIKDIFGEADYEGFYENWIKPAKEMLARVNVTFAPPKVTVENGVAAVPDSVVDIAVGKDTVIDVTDTAKKADSVELKAETVDKLADNETAVQIKLPDATVSFDKTAMGTIGQQAGQADVTIQAKKAAITDLNTAQKDALNKSNVVTFLSLEATAGQTKISDFGGGKVTISMPFIVPAGKKAADFVVAYVADNGTVTEMPTTHGNNYIQFTTTHFSDYVVVEKATLPDSNPKTGDNGMFLLPVALLTVSLLGLAVCVTKRRMF